LQMSAVVGAPIVSRAVTTKGVESHVLLRKYCVLSAGLRDLS
jgi:hypothetical protein